MFASAWPERLNRFVVPGPTRIDADGRRWAMLNAGERGIIADGPLFPLRAGRSCLRFRVRGLSGSAPCAVRLDLTRGLGDRETPIASTTVACGDEGGVAEVEVVLTDEMTFGFRTRLYNVGGGAGEVLLACDHLQDTTR
jgi:hypothetical protein